MNIIKLGKLSAAVALASMLNTPAMAADAQPTMSEADFEKAKSL